MQVALKSDALTLFGRHICSTTARPSRPIKGSPFQIQCLPNKVPRMFPIVIYLSVAAC